MIICLKKENPSFHFIILISSSNSPNKIESSKSIWNFSDLLIKEYIALFEEIISAIILFICMTKENETFDLEYYIYLKYYSLLLRNFLYIYIKIIMNNTLNIYNILNQKFHFLLSYK